MGVFANPNLNLNISLSQVISSGVITGYNVPAALTMLMNFGGGTAAGKADTVHAKLYTLAATPTTIDLTSLLDLSGASVTFARVRLLAAWVTTLTAGYLVTMSPGASNGLAALTGASGAPIIPAGFQYTDVNANVSTIPGLLLFQDWASVGSNGFVVDSTHKTLKFDPGANTVSMGLLIIGGSAAS